MCSAEIGNQPPRCHPAIEALILILIATALGHRAQRVALGVPIFMKGPAEGRKQIGLYICGYMLFNVA